VISLFNGTIPFIALQMQALQIQDQIALVFTTVVDELTRGLVDEDEDAEATPTDRTYWEARASRETVGLADELLKIVREFEASLELKYNKFYIGLSRDGQPFNFVTFRPRKNRIHLELKLPLTEEVTSLIENAGLETLEYNKRWNIYRLPLTKTEIHEKREALRELIKRAYEQRTG
jgi:hypothetical protein